MSRSSLGGGMDAALIESAGQCVECGQKTPYHTGHCSHRRKESEPAWVTGAAPPPEKVVVAGRFKVENDAPQVGGTHYRGFTQQHWDYAWERKFDQFQYSITKYVERWKLKDGLQGLYKARQNLNKYIELVEAQEAEAARIAALVAGKPQN